MPSYESVEVTASTRICCDLSSRTPVENAEIVPLRTVTRDRPCSFTPTESRFGFGQLRWPLPGPVMLCPPRSTVIPSAPTMSASPPQVRSCPSTKSFVMVWPHPAVEGATLAEALGAPALAELGAPLFGGWQAAATSTAMTKERRIVRKPK